MSSIYDQIKKLYDALNEGEMKRARELLSDLVGKGVNKEFIAEGFKTIAFTKEMELLYDEVEKNKKK